MSPVGFKLREYQEEAVRLLVEGWAGGERALAVQLPTGMGKTVIFSALARERVASTGRVLILVHRDELVRQALSKLHGTLPRGATTGVIKGAIHEPAADVVVGSVQTLGRSGSRKLSDLAPDHFGTIVVDEAHHAAADSYRRIFDHFPDARMAGFSATLERQDKRGLGDVWERVVMEKSIIWGIRKGYLTDVRGKAVTVQDLDLGKVKKSGGDYQDGDLGDALIDSGAPEQVADAYLEHAAQPDGTLRQGVAFWPTVAAAHEGADAMNAAGIKTEVITGSTPLEERTAIYARVRDGVTTVLSNCMVLTEGFDMPQLSCVVIARPTTSRALYVQMAGRGLRPFPGKTDCLLLDVAGVSSRLKLASIADLSLTRVVEEGESLTEAEDRELEEDEERAAAVPPPAGTSGTIKVTDVDLFGTRSQMWLQTRKGYWFIPAGDWTVVVVPHDTLEVTYDVWALYTGWRNRQPHRSIITDVTLEYAMVWAEGEAEDLDASIAKRTASWRKRKEPASEAQLRMAANLHIMVNDPKKITKRELSDLISIVIASRAADSYTIPVHTPSELDG